MAAAEETSDLALAQPTPEDVAALSISSFGYPLPAHQLQVYHQLTCEFLQNREGLKRDFQGSELVIEVPVGTESLDSSEKREPPPQQSACWNFERREFTLLPASGPENPYGAWTLRCHLTEETGVDTIPGAASLPLKGKRLVIKDNIPIRGMPMYCGTPFSFIPHADSPLITRCLAAGATIVGKAQCEFMCLSGASHTASAGVVRNPLAVEYHAGGSSSGCAVLVASGDADLSIGCDQGGSIRIPSAANGVVGCKPTHGLVPYTWIDGFYGPVDHAGPITRTVEDNALLLSVLAGWDGVDERASAVARKMDKIDYCSGLKGGVKGMRVGVVEEGFTAPRMEADIVAATQDAAKALEELGAKVEKVSVPLHGVARIIWQWYALGRIAEGILSGKEKELWGVDEKGTVWRRGEFMREQLLLNVGRWSVSFHTAMLAGEWIRTHHPEAPQAIHAHLQCLIDCYTLALSHYHVLLMPTIPHKPTPLPVHLSTTHDYEHASSELLVEHFETALGLTPNTLAINMTGHPALSMPVGGGIVIPMTKQGVVTSDNALTKGLVLPLSVMLVGNYFQEATLYQVAYALEQARPWRSSLYHEGHALSPT